MIRVLFKEALLVFAVWMGGSIFLFLNGVVLSSAWSLFCLMLGLFTTGGSLFLNYWVNRRWGFPALVFVVFSLLNQILFLAILFIFLEPREPHHRMIAMSALAGYLVCFLWDIRWKLKLFQTYTDENNREN